ncbi:MAG: acyltransferase, partial [Bacilli bacterium]|nr:acyltransferase [Bacilli bacterium]
MFFMLSGFGIYNSLKNQEEQHKKFKYMNYIKKRLKRVAPQYYVSLGFLLLITGSAAYLSRDHIITLFSHLFFFHNLYYTAAGAISGVCWTLGVTFQFYLIAPFLYHYLERKPKITLFLSFFFSLFIKVFIFHFIIASSGQTNSFLYFNYGSQIFTATQFFVIGMYVAKKIRNLEEKPTSTIFNAVKIVILVVSLYFLLELITNTNIPYLKNTGLYSDCTVGYIWHHVLAIILGLIMYYVSKFRWKLNSIVSQIFLFISKYEYGIYIWHLIIITNLTENAPIIKSLIGTYPMVVYLVLSIICILVGYIMTKIIDEFDLNKLNLNKNILVLTIKLVLLVIILLIAYHSVKLINPMINNFKNISKGNVVNVNASKKIADHASEMMDINSSCKYIYVDTEETGYLYFYQLRYYLS